jgi:serine/threonine-protein kinase
VDTTLQDPLVGRELDGRYLVRSRIARGGMATVYLAVDVRLDREVALKVMHAHLADDEQFRIRFVREARAAARLSHPNVVQVFDQGAEGDTLYLAMEHLRGRTLRDVLAERRVLTPREALTVVEPVLDALAAAHRHGIVHRDVKPENVILTDDGRVKVADFGLARAATASTSTTGVLLGTVAYLAPELVVRGIADARSDVYAVGIVLFEMLTGRQPFSGDVPIQVAYQHVNATVPPPSQYVAALPRVLDDLVLAATAREPDNRPADAGELLTRLRTARGGLTSTQLDARPDPPPRGTPGTPGDDGRAPHAPGAVTEVFDAPQRAVEAPNPTQALPPDLLSGWRAGSSGRSRGIGALARPLRARAEADDTDVDGDDGTHDDRHDGYLGNGPRGGLGRPGVTRPDPAPVAAPGVPAVRGTPGPSVSEVGQGRPDTDDHAAFGALLRRRRVTGLVALITVIALALGLAAAAWYYAAGPGAYTQTPDVVNQQAEQARQVLTAKGLRSTQTEVFAAAAGGVVVSTDPGPGAAVRKDGSVELRVSKGPEQVTVPKVTGLQESAARDALTQAHLVPGDSAQQYSDQAKGSVLRADPAVGSTVRNGSTVTLTISKGPQPVTVPDLTGKSRQDAEAALKAVRLGWTIGPGRNDDNAPAGTVLSQSPSDGTLMPGAKVTLILSKGPVLVAVPNVVGQQVAQARLALTAAGFDMRRTNVLGGFFGTVRAQNPAGGSMAPKGSTIVVTVV